MTDKQDTGQRLVERLERRLNDGDIEAGDWLLYELAIMADENSWVKERVFGWLEQFRKQDLEEAADRGAQIALCYAEQFGDTRDEIPPYSKKLLNDIINDVTAYKELEHAS